MSGLLEFSWLESLGSCWTQVSAGVCITNIYAGKSFCYDGKEMGERWLLFTIGIALLYYFCLCYLHPCLLRIGFLGHDYLLIVYFTKCLIGVFKCCWSLLWKFDMGESKEKIIFRVAPYYFDVRKSSLKETLFPLFWKKKKSSFLFIKEAASLAGNNFSPLARNINNSSRREQRNHINHVCMDIFYFKIIFLNLKNIHDCLIQVQ